jgi:hypothetical protein
MTATSRTFLLSIYKVLRVNSRLTVNGKISSSLEGINISNVSGKKAKPKVITFKDGGKVTVTTAE